MDHFKEVRSLEDLEYLTGRCEHVLTLFSGGVDSSYLLYKLASCSFKVTALAIDLGDGTNLEDLQQIAQHFGADLRVVDGRRAFVDDAVLPAIQAGAQYMGIYPISSSLSRPIIAKLAVDMAGRLGCDAILHTANQSQNSLRRLNGALRQLRFAGYTGSPYEYSAFSREEKIAALSAAGLYRFQARGISGDANLWVREYESGCLDNPENFVAAESIYKWTAANQVAVHDEVKISILQGRPVALNGLATPLIDIIEQLNLIAGSFGIGRYSGLEHLQGGEKVLEVREAPAATVLLAAYRHLETATLDAELIREKLSIEQLWVREAIEGRWFGDLRRAASGFISETAKHVSGTVSFRLRSGAADLSCIRAEQPLYLTDRDQWEKDVARQRGSRGLFDLQLPAPSICVATA
ncbi:argininosuccinate synthase [Halopseudomonas laoshanensis]|uniref:argininosuccinate synthase n=1 Tax=Halopseudomonas laoshanensis TaxID=2268758 RepID=A0A7V7GVF3_9GAMM|nr:argininosuccinate synthase-related protein [Halopseudomonas laoshanensis]KAA0696099.1 argininosuccinate synthase [Halopseudomonas laoshanensis]